MPEESSTPPLTVQRHLDPVRRRRHLHPPGRWIGLDNEQAKTLYYGDVTLFLLPNPDSIRDLLGMEVDIYHTKEYQRKPKRSVIPLFPIIDHLKLI